MYNNSECYVPSHGIQTGREAEIIQIFFFTLRDPHKLDFLHSLCSEMKAIVTPLVFSEQL